MKKSARRTNTIIATLYPYSLTIPSIVLFTGFFIIPILGGIGISMTNWIVTKPGAVQWVWLRNYFTIWQDTDIVLGFKNTIIFTFSIVIIRNTFALLLAVALIKPLHTRGLLRTVFYVPAVLSYIVVGIMFTTIFQMNGTFNEILRFFGIICKKEWIASPDTALIMVIVVDVWKWTGFHMIIYIAGLQVIPTMYYEASQIDGANAVQRFVHITLPMLIPALTINITQSFIGGFRVFEQVLTLTGGGPGHTSTTVSMMIYEYFGRGFYGKSSAISMVLSILVLIVSVFIRRQFRRMGADI